MTIKKIVFSGVFSYPEGIAASSRIRALAKGMLSIDKEVHVISMYSHGHEDEKWYGKKYDIDSIMPLSKSFGTINKIINKLKLYKNINHLVHKTLSRLDGSDQEILFIYGRSFIFINSLLHELCVRGFQTKTVFDVVEPHRQLKSRFEYIRHPLLWDSSLVFKLLLSKFTACTYITKSLLNKYPNNDGISYLLPGVKEIDNKRNNLKHDIPLKLRIGYLGALFDKDYPELLFLFCKSLNERQVDWDLSIIGRFNKNKNGYFWVDKIIHEFSENRIKTYCDPSDQRKEELIQDVDYIVLFRKPYLLQEFTFPTRSVEVMASGKVLISNTYGEFCNYLSNYNSAVLIDENKINESVDLFIKNHTAVEYNKKINSTHKLMIEMFNAEEHCKKLIELLVNK